ncbi:MAG TPA: hypothetical protein VGJ81_19650 [Thermoanaerobaculia bacterium]|jgi:hypothetical protein
MGNLGAVLLGVAANAAWAGILYLLKRVQDPSGRWHPFVRVGLLVTASVIFIVANEFYRTLFPEYSVWFLALSFSLLAFSWWSEVRRYWRLGIVGIGRAVDADRYGGALALCSNSFDFLGIGARKLTDKQPAFEEAVNRCHRPNRPIRFLLCAPDNPQLIAFARQAGEPEGEYQEKVKSSLRAIRRLHDERARNIEVRFYEQLPVFRLMFVNDELCLASYYVFGEGDGSQLPDVYIRRRAGKRDVESIYYGFRRYFDLAWESASPWDFSSHMG